MKVIFHEMFYDVYTSDPAAEAGRMEAVMDEIEGETDIITALPAGIDDIERIHSKDHIQGVKMEGLYDISSLAAGGAIMAAETGLKEPCFALIRPPGHHASSGSAWGFCFFNNMSIALEYLKFNKKINTAYVLDIDMHHGDGNENILSEKEYVVVHNLHTDDREKYLNEIKEAMETCESDIIGISAGFDNHINDWGGVLYTEDYYEIGKMVKNAAVRNNGGCFAILEGGYNHNVLGRNVLALIKGLDNH